MTRPADIQEFKVVLKQTVDWCCHRFSMTDPATSLRSAALQPARNVTESADEAEVDSVVGDVVRRRSSLLQKEVSRVPTGLNHKGTYLGGGRLLAFRPLESLSHGLSVPETGGFIDVDEIPPWDSWVYFTDDYLVSWVPGNLESAVEIAIECNPERCILWLSDVATEFAATVRREGLI